MVATSDEVRRELQITRERMGDTLAELERKLNPRFVIQNHPMAALGVAFGTGVALGTARGTEQNGLQNLRRHLRPTRAPRMDHEHPVGNVIDDLVEGVKSALLAAGTAKLGEFLDSLMRQYTENSSPRATTANPGRRW